MMKNKFRIGLLSMAAVGLVGCADKLTDDVAQMQGEEAENYVVFKIGNIGSETRGTADGTPEPDQFEEGLAEEHAVSTKAGANVVYFFDDNGNNLPSSVLEVLGQQENDDDHNGQYTEGGKEKVYQARIKGTKEQLSKYKQCLIVLNGDPMALDGLKDKGLTEVLEALNEGLGWLKDGNTNYFTMSNTVYVDEDLNIKSAEEVNPNTQICTTMAEAQAHPITVHVERVLAKFELGKVDGNTTTWIKEETEISPTATADDDKNLYVTLMTSTEEEPGTTGGNTQVDDNEEADHYTEWKASKRKWKVNIVGWGMNATESETYLFKNLKDKNGTTFSADGKFGDYWKWNYANYTIGWNDYNRVRSYWAVDPHYNQETTAAYPHQYRIIDGNNDKSGGVFDKNTYKDDDGKYTFKEGLVLNYNSYNGFMSFPGNGYNYTVENTFDYNWFTEGDGYDFKGYDYKRTGTHAIIAAELLISTDENGNNWEKAKTLYQYDGYYWEATVGERYKDMSKSLKKYMLNQVLFHWSLDKGFKELYTDVKHETPLVASSENFDKYFEVVAATVKGGDGRAMMKLKDNVTLFYEDENGEDAEINYEEKNKESYDAFTQNYLYEYGTARRFDGGKMYYYIPIQHMSADNGKTADEYEYNVGRWGVVRNHWYKLNINAIKNPGIPVDDPDQPIIPSDDPDQDYYAAFEIVILPWHVINNSVTFE